MVENAHIIIVDISEQDARIILNPETRALRERAQMFLTMYRPALNSAVTADRAPSYVTAALRDVLAAFDRWQADEWTLLKKEDHG